MEDENQRFERLQHCPISQAKMENNADTSITYITRVYKAKYFPKSTLLEARRGNHSSYAWRSIYQGNKLISQGKRWIVGKGSQIRVWKENWLPLEPSRPARSITPNILILI